MNWWETLVVVLVGIPLLVLWVALIIDLFRRSDLSGIKIATWVVLLLVLPFIGAIVYLVVRPRTPMYRGTGSDEDAARRFATDQAITYDTPGGVGPRSTIPPMSK